MANEGDRVAVHYHGTLDDGTVFDSSREREPLEFVIGEGQVIPGFDKAARSLEIGQSIVVRLEPADAYGAKNEELVFEVPMEQVPEPLKIGDRVELVNGATARVTMVTSESVTVDANHPMSDQALTFEVELVASR